MARGGDRAAESGLPPQTSDLYSVNLEPGQAPSVGQRGFLAHLVLILIA